MFSPLPLGNGPGVRAVGIQGSHLPTGKAGNAGAAQPCFGLSAIDWRTIMERTVVSYRESHQASRRVPHPESPPRSVHRLLAFCGILSVLGLISGCSRDGGDSRSSSPDARIVGSWSSVGGDYALTNEYRPDGMLVQHVGAQKSKPMPYRIEGEYLVVSVKQPDGKVSDSKDRFVLEGDTLTFLDPNGSKRVFRRTK